MMPNILYMNIAKLDFYFPFFVFAYGLLVIFVLENPALRRIGAERLNEAWARLEQHKNIAWISFFVGGLWSLQNVWLGTVS